LSHRALHRLHHAAVCRPSLSHRPLHRLHHGIILSLVINTACGPICSAISRSTTTRAIASVAKLHTGQLLPTSLERGWFARILQTGVLFAGRRARSRTCL
jgi:hypothetical protein